MPTRGDNRSYGIVLALLALLPLLSCKTAEPPRATAALPPAIEGACRVGPNGAPDGAIPSSPQAERGIGGTGARLADRGIGGTGIIGTITGFASVCINDMEVQLPSGLPVGIDGRPGSTASLRVGQVAVIEADDLGGLLIAGRVDIRHEVVGPVTRAVDPAGSLAVAGQTVLLADDAWVLDATGAAGRARLARLGAGTWLAVSGLHREDGVLVASRIDAQAPGPVVVHGVLATAEGGMRVGGLKLRLLPGAALPGQRDVTVTGWYRGEVLTAQSVTEDAAMADPASAFGAVRTLSIEAYVGVNRNRVLFPGGYSAAAAPALTAPSEPARAEIVDLQRSGNGLFGVAAMHGRTSSGQGGPGAAPPAGAGGGGDPASLRPAPGSAFDPAGQDPADPSRARPNRLGPPPGR